MMVPEKIAVNSDFVIPLPPALLSKRRPSSSLLQPSFLLDYDFFPLKLNPKNAILKRGGKWLPG